ncbi:MAG: glycosyltransferase, partial [Cyanobacteria bacterium J06636_28]
MLLTDQATTVFESAKGKNEKILLVANTGWYLYNFRLPLLLALRERGAQVVLVSPWDQYVEKLQAEGFWWIDLDLVRRSTNPFLELYTIFRLVLIYLVEKPDIVHH